MNDEIHKLLQLKRYEHPSPDYFERFIDQFHERQRAELLKQPTIAMIWEKIVNTFPDFRVPRLAYAGVAMAALVLSATILITQQDADSTTANTSLALTSAPPTVNILPIGESNLRMPVSSSSREEFPPHYVLEARPVSYESPYSF